MHNQNLTIKITAAASRAYLAFVEGSDQDSIWTRPKSFFPTTPSVSESDYNMASLYSRPQAKSNLHWVAGITV